MYSYEELWTEYMKFSKNVKTYRHMRCLTQEQLAEKANISISYIKQIEAGKEVKNVTLIYILKISKALEIPIASLFKETKTVKN